MKLFHLTLFFFLINSIIIEFDLFIFFLFIINLNLSKIIFNMNFKQNCSPLICKELYSKNVYFSLQIFNLIEFIIKSNY